MFSQLNWLNSYSLYSYFQRPLKWNPILFLILGVTPLFATENQVTGIDGNGSIVAVWQENTLLGTEIKSSAFPFSSLSWEIPVIISGSAVASLPKLVVAANGLDTISVAIWTEMIGGTTHLYAAMRPSLSGGWTSAILISNGIEEIVGTYDLALNPSGKVVASWDSLQGGSIHLRSSTANIGLGNIWSSPTSISL
jgi:hypothetical protein